LFSADCVSEASRSFRFDYYHEHTHNISLHFISIADTAEPTKNIAYTQHDEKN